MAPRPAVRKATVQIASLNCRGRITANTQELGTLLASQDIDILGAQEVKSHMHISVPGYDWIPGLDRFLRPRHHLGIGFFIKKSLRGLTSFAAIDKDHEFMWLKLAGQRTVQDTYICVLYCLTQKHPVEQRKAFYAALLESCSSFMAKGEVVLLGDFNARLGLISGDRGTMSSNGKLLLAFLRSAFADGEGDWMYVSLLNASPGGVGVPTREETGKTSTIDYLITAPESLTRVQDVHVENCNQSLGANALGSDHHLLFVDWKLVSEELPKANPNRTIKNYQRLQDPVIKAAYQKALTSELAQWSLSLEAFSDLCNDSNSPQDVILQGLDSKYESLIQHIAKAEADTFPTKVVGPNARSWWDEELQDLIKSRTEAHEEWKSFCQSPGYDASKPNAIYQLLWNKYVQLRRRAHSLASAKKSQEYQNMLSNLKTDYISDRQHFFKEILRIRRKKSPSSQISALRVDGNARIGVTSRPSEIKQILHELHSKMGKEDPQNNKFDQPHYHTIAAIVAAINPSEVGPIFCEKEISFNEINDAVAEAQNQKACGLDQVHNEPLKHGGKSVFDALRLLFNLLLKTGSSPSLWAKALVHLMFKRRGSDPLDPVLIAQFP
jgi:endonuclease/exonuclease/phosphatase family metal-dependent hydrolase